ncbi:MAG: ABC transporter substrate-binding protein [Anaerolineae bacterium]|nr:ABC transporter substrate-binding protein [Anaerolineae bacterium]
MTLLVGCGAQPKVYRVGILSGTDDFLAIGEGFKAEMTRLGYIEGENIVYDLQRTNAEPDEMERIAKQFVDDKVDLIFTFPTEPALAVKEATQGTGIPVIFAYAGIEGAGLVENVREPGGNITGVRYPGPEQMTKRIELLAEIIPQARRVWIGYDKNYPNTAPALEVMRPLAEANGIELIEVPAATIADLEADLAARTEADDLGIDAIILMPDIFNHSPEGWEIILSFAQKHKVPIAGSFFYTVEMGAIFGNANDFINVGALAAPLADKIFKGTPAGTIPVVTPEQEVYINYIVAQDLGVTVPEGLLRQAAQIVQ